MRNVTQFDGHRCAGEDCTFGAGASLASAVGVSVTAGRLRDLSGRPCGSGYADGANLRDLERALSQVGVRITRGAPSYESFLETLRSKPAVLQGSYRALPASFRLQQRLWSATAPHAVALPAQDVSSGGVTVADPIARDGRMTRWTLDGLRRFGWSTGVRGAAFPAGVVATPVGNDRGPTTQYTPEQLAAILGKRVTDTFTRADVETLVNRITAGVPFPANLSLAMAIRAAFERFVDKPIAEITNPSHIATPFDLVPDYGARIEGAVRELTNAVGRGVVLVGIVVLLLMGVWLTFGGRR